AQNRLNGSKLLVTTGFSSSDVFPANPWCLLLATNYSHCCFCRSASPDNAHHILREKLISDKPRH
ncbi:hypothetical protein, partial [Klebsiella grimontii]|uniref:hypothetical protein n=1 Tax=Klebsiella grimontii TaxID=2058152 RepID=UPI0039EF7677